MTKMIERVARAIAEEDAKINGWQDVARAAIDAMREPTEAMKSVGADVSGNSQYGASLIWQAMIDAALGDQGEGE